MSQSTFKVGVGTGRALDIRAYPSRRRRNSGAVPRQELEVRLADLQKMYAELHTEIFEAAQVHRHLCAPRQLHFGNFEIASEIFAVRHLPGDFFTVEEKNGVIFALGDICGKGLAAGMWTTHVVGLVGAHAAATSAPEQIVAGVNRDLCLIKSLMPLASLFLARLDPIAGVLEYCSAGHPPALLLRASGELEFLSEGGMLLGVVPETPYNKGFVKLNSGDVLVVYSDGITDSTNCAGEEFGEARLHDQLRHAHAGIAHTQPNGALVSPANEMLFSVLGAVQDFAAACPLVDDMSLAIIRRDG
jgi:serine phosphatase RsbU (regulator of sigma subunit)